MSFYGFHEEFLKTESKVHQIMTLLEDISNSNKKEEELATTKKQTVKDIYEEINEDNFLIAKRGTTITESKPKLKMDSEIAPTWDFQKFTFMQQLENVDRRAIVLKDQERICQKFRTLGNEAYRKRNYERAINLYSKAIEYIKDSPILYNNRALTYVKLKSYKRAIMDCDYVLNRLDQKNLTSWLYRAVAYQKLGDEKSYENSIEMARRTNPKKLTQLIYLYKN